MSDREGPAGSAIAAETWLQENKAKSVLLEVSLDKGKVILEVSNIIIKPEAAIQVFYLKDLFCRWCQDLLQMQTSEIGKIFLFFFFIQADFIFYGVCGKRRKDHDYC